MSLITLDHITVRFGEVTAIPDLSLHIEEGEFFTLLGPSGCGKSTALRTLAGLIDPAGGRIHVDGRDVTTLPSDKRGIGMVFQNYALFPSMSVRENIGFGLRVAKRSREEIRQRVQEVARQVELEPAQLERSVAELSGGQQQRVAIARALVLEPRILLLDEPLSNLDARLRAQLRVQLKELQQKVGITTVYVTHDQDEALALSDRIAVLDRGGIEQVGTPREIYEESATEFVCTFIGSVNRVRPRTVARLAAQDPQRIHADRTSYVRVERVGLFEVGGAPAELVCTPGVVETSTYHGDSVLYRVRVDDHVIRVHVPYHPAQRLHRDGTAVEVGLAPSDLLQYAPGVEART